MITAAVAAILGIAAIGEAAAYSPRVESACRGDYFRLCPSYPLGSASLRLCMESKSKQITRPCVQALIDAGEVDRRRVKRGF